MGQFLGRRMSLKHVRSCKGRSEAITDLLAYDPASVMPLTTMTRLGGGSSSKASCYIRRTNRSLSEKVTWRNRASKQPDCSPYFPRSRSDSSSSHKAEDTTASAAVQRKSGTVFGRKIFILHHFHGLIAEIVELVDNLDFSSSLLPAGRQTISAR